MLGYQIVTKIPLASYSNGLFLATQSPQWSSRPSGHLSSRCWHMILGCFQCVWLLLYQHLLLWPLWWAGAGWKEGLESWEVEIHEPMTNFKCEEVILLICLEWRRWRLLSSSDGRHRQFLKPPKWPALTGCSLYYPFKENQRSSLDLQFPKSSKPFQTPHSTWPLNFQMYSL